MKNKVALVTGSTAGIGFAIAEERVNKAVNQILEKKAKIPHQRFMVSRRI